jgi:hypothetical protein
MFNLASAPPPADVPATLQTLSDMASLLADPAAAKQRVADMQAATAAFQQAADDQKTQMAAFAVAEADHQRAIDEATAEATDKISSDRAAFDAECMSRKAELDQRETQLTQLQAKAQADADAAAADRADYERRLSLIKAAQA